MLSLPRVFSEMFSSLGGAAAHLCPPPTPSRKMCEAGALPVHGGHFLGTGNLKSLHVCSSL